MDPDHSWHLFPGDREHTPSRLLDESTILEYLRGRGTVAGADVHVRVLSGGVSNAVFLVEDGHRRIVVKQALPKLRVKADWFADPARSQVEAEALERLHAISPDAVPRVLDRDPDRHTLTICAAPSDWRSWKDDLLAGSIRSDVASRLGTLLSGWHTATERQSLSEALEDPRLFEQLRLEPYFGAAAVRRPELAADLDGLVRSIRSRRRCLVLGDFSPKNILVGDEGLWVIDLEVAHRGDPAFDVAFLLSHLAAKSVHVTGAAAAIGGAAGAFIGGYGTGPALDDEEHLVQVFAGLLLARVYGSSPLEYLGADERALIARRAKRQIHTPAHTIAESWKEITGQ